MSKREGISFIDASAEAWLREDAPEDGLCVRRFHADLVIEGLMDMQPGDVLYVHGKKYQILEMGKKCHGDCRLLQRQGQKCPLAGGVAFGKIL